MSEHPLYEEPVWGEEGLEGYYINASSRGVTPSTVSVRKVQELLTGLDENKLMAALTAPEEEVEDGVISEEDRLKAGTVERMPSQIRAMMLLAESYDLLEGDIHEIMNVPIDVGLTDITIDCSDNEVKKVYQDLFTALNMQEMVEYNWLYCASHGQSFPLQIWEDNIPQSIVHLDPKAVNIGNPLGFGARSMSLDDAELKKRLSKQKDPMIVFDSFGAEWNSFDTYGSNIPLKPEYVDHLHMRKWPHTRYAIPPIARAYRSVTTRQRLEEMVLATIEGVKNQLWLFTKERFARGEAEALDGVLAETRGDHLGYLIWPNLDVKQYVPGSIDQLLAPEKWFDLTRHIFRQLGISMYVVSGELPGGTRANPEIDVRLLMLKVEADRRRQLRWLRSFARKFAKRNNIKESVTIGFRLNTFDQEDLIKNTLAPLATFGQISSHTFLKEVGYDYDMERDYKREELPDKYLFGPMKSFSQEAVKPGGEVTTKESSGQLGRTPDAQNPDQMMKASVEDYQAAISRSYDDVEEAETEEERRKAIAAFIASLMMSNISFMREAYEAGYRDSGGLGEPDRERMKAVVEWNNEYARQFKEDMLEGVGSEDMPDFRWRADMYAPQGWRRAYMSGTFQARKEQGYKGWRRILGESPSGPCEWCIADSQITHSIEEEWTDHPHGRCKQEVVWLSFWRGSDSTMPMRVPSLEGPVPRVSGR